MSAPLTAEQLESIQRDGFVVECGFYQADRIWQKLSAYNCGN